MESVETTAREKQGGQEQNRGTSGGMMSNKPLHRFLTRDPRNFGIVVLIMGCAELLMGFQLAYVSDRSSYDLYIPIWQGALFFTSGILSILTDVFPSKKMVTMCLAFYVISILGSLVSFSYRVFFLGISRFIWHSRYPPDRLWQEYRRGQIYALEAVLCVCTSCMFGLLIFLSTIARLALKSTHTQVIVQCVTRPPESDVMAD